MLLLYDQYGNLKASLSPDEHSVQTKEIQGDNVLSLSFTLYEYVSIDVNDYVDFCGERYWAVERYMPDEKSSMEWLYSVNLYGIESMIKRFLVLKNVEGENEAVFTLTGRAIDHVRLIVSNINSGMGTTSFKVGEVVGTDNIVVDYFGKYCDEGLKEVAEKSGAEWWIDGETVNISRCERGSELTLGYGNGLTGLSRDVADSPKFYTRLFPIGSRRNIDPSVYGYSRLQLPGGVKYVDVNVERYGVIHHYEEDAFSGIYPRRVGHVSSVRCEHVRDSEGNPFDIYYFKDDDLDFDPNDYEIGGLVKHVSFQEGSELAGLGQDEDHYFEVNFNSLTREFEIITIWPYDDDTQVPGGLLVPKAGDAYILWNLRMPDEYYSLAESEFKQAVDDYNAEHGLDVSVYKGGTDHVWIEEENAEVYVGRRVRLESAEYFPETGFRSSRVTKVIRNVVLPSLMDLEISDALSRGTLSKIEDSISDVRNYTGSVVGGLNVPDVIKSWESTKPTDNNINSARRSDQRYLRKDVDDVAHGNIGFEQSVSVGGELSVGDDASVDGDVDVGGGVDVGGALDVVGRQVFRGLSTFRSLADFLGGWSLPYDRVGLVRGVVQLLDPDGVEKGRIVGSIGHGQLSSMRVLGESVVNGTSVFHELLGERIDGKSENFSDGFDGWGSRLWKDSSDLWHLTVDVLTARHRMNIFELIVQKLRSVGGTLVVSSASGRLKRVINYDGYYLLEFEGGNEFVAGDWMSCRRWTSDGVLKSWTVEVVGVQDGMVRVNSSGFASGVEPEVGDDVVQLGNSFDSDRQNVIYITSSDGGSRIDMVSGLRDGVLGHGRLVVRLGDLDGMSWDLSSWSGSGPVGWGFYGENCYLKGEFVVVGSDGGEMNVGRVLKVLSDRIESSLHTVRRRMSSVSLLRNGSFDDGMTGWRVVGGIVGMLSDGDDLLSDGEELLYSAVDGDCWVALVDDGCESYLRLHGDGVNEALVEQLVDDMDDVEIVGGSARLVELRFRYRSNDASSGLSVMLESDNDGVSGTLSSEGEGMYGLGSLISDGEWHDARIYGTYAGGTGCLRLGSVGEMDISRLELVQAEGVESLSSRFEQTVDGLRGLVNSVSEEVSGLSGDVAGLSSTVAGQGSDLTTLSNDLLTTRTTLTGQYESLSGQYTALNTRVTEVGDGLSRRVDALETAGFVTRSGFSSQLSLSVKELEDFYDVGTDDNGERTYTLKLATLDGVRESISNALSNYVERNALGDYALRSDLTALAGRLNTFVTTDGVASMLSGFYELDEHGDVVYVTDAAGNYVADSNGEPIPKLNISAQISTYQFAETEMVGVRRVLKGGVLVRADQVDFESGNFSVSANHIDFRGYTDINGLSIDEEGIVMIHGVVNNGLLELDGDNRNDYMTSAGMLDVLRLPSTVRFMSGDYQQVCLPCLYHEHGTPGSRIINGSTRLGGSGWREMTADEMRSLVGKKIYFYYGGRSNPESMILSDLLVEVSRHELSVANSEGVTAGSSLEIGGVTKRLKCVPGDALIGVGGGERCFVIAECKLGVWDGFECVYWEATVSGYTEDVYEVEEE